MITVRSDALGKAYKVYRRPIDSLKELFLSRDYSETFWALRDVTLEVERGGSLGVVGDNGAGKSTLLKLLAGAIAPTTGRVEHEGRLAAVLNLSAGFHPELSGTENIRIGCAVLGLSRSASETLLPSIVDFSELGPFADRPVRTYSSGMCLRLGFAVATATTPDVLVTDEHLSVGDQHFQHKCLRRIAALREAGCTLIVCSHNLYLIRDLCERTLWLRDGRPAMLGGTDPVLRAYQDHVRERDAESAGDEAPKAAAGPADGPSSENRLVEVALTGDVRSGRIVTHGTLRLTVIARLTDAARRDGAHVGVLIIRNDAVWCYGVSTKMDGLADGLFALDGETYGISFVIEDLPLLSGEYTFTVALLDGQTPHVYDRRTGAAPFRVRQTGEDVGVARMHHRWERP